LHCGRRAANVAVLLLCFLCQTPQAARCNQLLAVSKTMN